MTGERRQAGPPTIPDVARRAGVSSATAGRALGGYGYTSEETRKRVLAAADELGYRRNEIARSMATGRTFTIGVVIADIENPFFASATRAIRGFLTALSAEDWQAGITDIVACCTSVAQLSGGILGLGSKVCDNEKAVLARVAAELERGHKEEAEAFEKKLN